MTILLILVSSYIHSYLDGNYVKVRRFFTNLSNARLTNDQDPINIQDLLIIWRSVWTLALPEMSLICYAIGTSILAVLSTMMQPVIMGRAVDLVSNSMGEINSSQLQTYFAILFALVRLKYQNRIYSYSRKLPIIVSFQVFSSVDRLIYIYIFLFP